MAHDISNGVHMGPCLKWPEENGPSPVCNGSHSKGSWTIINGTSTCSACGKPSHGYLRFCEICEDYYVYDPTNLSAYRIQDFNPAMPRILPHAACARALQELSNG